ncbi:MAG: gliding motility-associated C-terminal domain-containing protein [Flavobacteriaceae bacterium]|nr:gliding motility-associated C-terminal domain-containing protein [Flavobacteriaceae bacterium]
MLKFSYACASASFNNFEVEVSYNTTVFNSDNVFTLELSDKDGSFTAPTVVKTISNQNSSFKFTTSFQIPAKAYGTGYKVRVKASSPQKTSPESDAFEAYFTTSKQLVLNNFTDVILCDGASKELNLNITDAGKYQWYKDGTKLVLGGPSITVSEPGLYYSEIYYGSCTAAVISNIVEVTKLPKFTAEILGNQTVELCEGNQYTLEAKEKNSNYKYYWYKDGVKLTQLPLYTPTLIIKDKDQLGTYHLEIENDNGCVATSNHVEIKESAGNLEVTEESDLTVLLLKGATKTLKINHNATSAAIEWFKDGVAIPSSNTKEITVNAIGQFTAKVTTTNGSCSFVKESKPFHVIALKSLIATIQTVSTFTDCTTDKTTLQLQKISATGTNDVSYTLAENQYKWIDFKWLYNGVAVSGATSKEIQINEYAKNGVYQLSIQSDAIVANSNSLTIQLKIPQPTITSSSVTNTICSGQTITLETGSSNGINYQWFKDGAPIAAATSNRYTLTETGVYKLKATGFGCSVESGEVTITAFDASVVQINTATDIVLNVGESKTITATGANDYLWKDEQNNSLSTTETLMVDKAGTYFLLAKVGACEVKMTITVTALGTEIIPNVVTSNGDGINDYWMLSNRYAFDKEITIEIYNTSGKQVFKTTNYQNNWPINSAETKSQLYYYVIKKNNKLLKKGTISVIK